jgi:hypothetical protein
MFDPSRPIIVQLDENFPARILPPPDYGDKLRLRL